MTGDLPTVPPPPALQVQLLPKDTALILSDSPQSRLPAELHLLMLNL